MRTCQNPGLVTFGEPVNRRSAEQSIDMGGVTYPGRYIVLRSVAKSVAVSENRMRGHPLGDSAAARLA